MARARNIKPAIMDNEELAELPPLTRLLFIYLWMLADREGRLEDRPKRIAAQALPYDRSADAEVMLSELEKAGFITRYEAAGARIIQVLNFAKHQAPHVREAASELPEQEQGTNKEVTKHNLGSSQASPRSPDSLIPDSLIPDSSLTSVSEGSQSAKPPAATRGSRLDPEWVLPRTWGEWALQEFPYWTPDVVRAEASKFKDHWLSESGAKARKVDWLATWRKWCRSDICQRSHPPPGQASETPYARQMRERVAEAAGSLAHIVAAKAPGQQSKPSPTPWDVAIENNRRTITTGVGGCDLLEAVDDLRT